MVREPWDQRLDETSEHYRQFLWWRDQVPRPAPSDYELARDFDWSTRAAAWDLRQSIPEGNSARLSVGLNALIETFVLQSRRALERTRVDPDYEINAKLANVLKSLVQIQLLVAETSAKLGEQGSIDTAGEYVETLTDDEQQVLLALVERQEKR